MTSLIVNGGRALRGRITPSANKNAVLPVLCATLLTDQPVTLHRVPDITDVRKILDFFRNLGSTVDMDFEAGVLKVRHGEGLDPKAAHLPLGMRSTLMLIPPLLHRFGAATIEEDATGCTLGAREIDPHIEVLQTFGATVRREPDALHMAAPGGYRAADHWLDYASVTTTENFMLCAATALGRSQLTNAACEPHVQEFCAFLALMGARIEGVGGSRIVVEGVERLSGAEFTFADDFHEVATFLAMGAITGGEVSVRNGSVDQFPLLDRTFAKFGVEVTHEGGWSTARAPHGLKVREPFTSNILTKVE
ncbi:MAG: UDP-N-acetylglucosamine 1-carboxyvinyltransferase, partial [Phenylobacterium sp.]